MARHDGLHPSARRAGAVPSPGEPLYALGVDYGTSSVRALVVDVATGEEIGAAVRPLAHGVEGVITDDRDVNLARQHPRDYIDGFVAASKAAVDAARDVRGFTPERIVGVGVDTTGSTPLPVDRDGVALAMHPEFEHDPAAMAWLWKDHTSYAEAAMISRAAEAQGLPYLSKCGGAYSSEWYWSKMLRCERTQPRVAAAAFSWVECCDYVPGVLTGNTDPATMARSICAAGHKAMYNESWGGLPSAPFLDSLAPGFSRYRERFALRALPADRRAGLLLGAFADPVGLRAGVPVAVGAVDAHVGAVGAGVAPGSLVKIIGASTCDCMVARMNRPLADIPGVCGIVPESILPGMYGIEAGQSAVGDIFSWYVRHLSETTLESRADAHARLTAAAARIAPGRSGLLALDWHNGNRTVLVDPLLTGVIVGQTLHTSQAEVYRALIEATAFGALTIINRIEEHGVRIERVVNCGGIAEKSPLVMQIYADVCGRPMYISRSAETCALGAAIFGAVVGGAHASVDAAQRAMTGVRDEAFHPRPAAVGVYRELFELYTILHDAFGRPGPAGDVHSVMKRLLMIRDRARSEG